MRSINNNKMASSCNINSNCPCCNKPTDRVFLTIWYKWDRGQEHGAGKWCDSVEDAWDRFVRFRKDDKICAALIDRDNKAIMCWDIDGVDQEEQPTKPKKKSNKKKSRRNNR